MKERNAEILRKRENGKTITEIAKEYGITKQRVAQIICNSEMVNELKEKDKFFAGIANYAKEHNVAIRIYNALHRHGICSLEELKKMPIEDIWKIKSIGAISVEVIIRLKADC